MNHERHMGIYQIPPTFSVTVIGAGGIGAVASLALAKMGVQYLTIYDFDRVGMENIATQLHKPSDVGMLKVYALMNTLKEFSDETTVFAEPHQVEAGMELRSHLIISAVDSISARKEIWEALLGAQSSWKWYLDCRMSAEEFQSFLVSNDPYWTFHYDEKLHALDDTLVPDVPCTEKATFYCAMMSAGHIGKIVRDIVRGEAAPHRLVHHIPSNTLGVFPY